MTQRLLVCATKATPVGNLVLETSHALAQAKDGINRLQGMIAAMMYGSPADYQAMADELGMTDAGLAADLAALLNSTATAIDVAIIAEFLARVDQGG